MRRAELDTGARPPDSDAGPPPPADAAAGPDDGVATDDRRGRVRRVAGVARRAGLVAVVAGLALLVAPDLASAHAGSIRGATRRTLEIPAWLFLSTGGAAVGASFLLASFVTDRVWIRTIHAADRRLAAPGRVAVVAAKLLGVAALVATVVVGYLGPVTPFRNLAVLLVWVAFWTGYVSTTYLVGNSWPSVNPFRTIAAAILAAVDRASLPRPAVDYPERLGAWPGVAALLAVVWLEVTSPLADDPRLLATTVAGYAAASVVGAVVVGPDVWFRRVDPIAKLLAYYGRVAPVERTGDGLRVRLPGTALSEPRLVTDRSEVAFVVAVVYVTTFDGLVGTGGWATVARAAVGVGLPPLVVYLVAFLGGFALFYAAFRLAVASARRTADTYLSADELARRFAPSLLAIAVGYHLAHNLGAFLTLAPTLASVVATPLAVGPLAGPPQNPPRLAALPGFVSGLELAAVLVGHLVAVWVAHATAYDLFPDRLQAVRSQYGVTAVMVLYTMTSLAIVTAAYVPPPFLAE